MGDPVCGNGGLRLILSGKSLVVAFQLVHLSEVVVFVDVLASYNNHVWIQITERNLARL